MDICIFTMLHQSRMMRLNDCCRRGVPLSRQCPTRPNLDRAVLDPTVFAFYFWLAFLLLAAASSLNLTLEIHSDPSCPRHGDRHLDKKRVEGGQCVRRRGESLGEKYECAYK